MRNFLLLGIKLSTQSTSFAFNEMSIILNEEEVFIECKVLFCVLESKDRKQQNALIKRFFLVFINDFLLGQFLLSIF